MRPHTVLLLPPAPHRNEPVAGSPIPEALRLALVLCIALALAVAAGACGGSSSSGTDGTDTAGAASGGSTDATTADDGGGGAGTADDVGAVADAMDHDPMDEDGHMEGDDHMEGDGHHEEGDAHADDHHEADGTDAMDDHGDDHDHGSGEAGTHIHAIQWWKDTGDVILGTHVGTWRTQAGATELVMLRPDGDFMGLIQDPFTPTRYWGSGHYAAGGFPNWGFIESLDGGTTWSEITLNGQVDFHHMAVGHDQADVVAGTFGGKVWFSADAGRTWESWAWTGQPTGLEVDSSTGPVFLMASASGIDRVTAPAMTAEPVVAANVSGIDRVGDGLGYGTSDGQIHLCDAALAGCDTVAGPSGAPVLHLLGAPDHLFALVQGSKVFHTEDAGAHWTLVVDGQ